MVSRACKERRGAKVNKSNALGYMEAYCYLFEVQSKADKVGDLKAALYSNSHSQFCFNLSLHFFFSFHLFGVKHTLCNANF